MSKGSYFESNEPRKSLRKLSLYVRLHYISDNDNHSLKIKQTETNTKELKKHSKRYLDYFIPTPSSLTYG